jgi:hypothetical protein
VTPEIVEMWAMASVVDTAWFLRPGVSRIYMVEKGEGKGGKVA